MNASLNRMNTSLKYDIPIYNSLPSILRDSKNKNNKSEKRDESFDKNDLGTVNIIKIENSEPFSIKSHYYLIYIFVILIFIYLIKILYFF